MSDPSKPSLIVRIPTPLWLIGFILVALVVSAALHAPLVGPQWPSGVGLVVAGVALSGWARLTFAKAKAEIMPSAEAHSTLVVGGPFRYMRNPMYLGLLIAAIGVALIVGTVWMRLVPLLIFLLDNFVVIPYEEFSMERQFGDSYRAYKKNVRRWI